ncbi:hypothetical protein GN244_ATG17637 [Phytophthora infestans]|uniref:Uncharacterized protein n=1 Tax=Phytophthora infestans TaxID=4787 RepID=A0A833WEA6_PHYIN|nr:hypothetical protein GN244_ATG17637 [Phytophthora infestans]
MTKTTTDTGSSREAVRFTARAAVEPNADTIASRTRARQRRPPYTDAEPSVGDETNAAAASRTMHTPEDASGVSAEQPATSGRVRGQADVPAHGGLRPGPDTTPSGDDGGTRHTATAAADAPARGRAVGPPDEEDEEPTIYVFAGRGRRGVDSLVSTRPRLSRWRPDDVVVERRRRRYRTRTGRYILEFEVERLGDRLDPDGPKQITRSCGDKDACTLVQTKIRTTATKIRKVTTARMTAMVQGMQSHVSPRTNCMAKKA